MKGGEADKVEERKRGVREGEEDEPRCLRGRGGGKEGEGEEGEIVSNQQDIYMRGEGGKKGRQQDIYMGGEEGGGE